MTNRIRQAINVLFGGVIETPEGLVLIERAGDSREVDYHKSRADRWHSALLRALKDGEQLRAREAKRSAKDANTIRSLTAQLRAQAAAHKRWRDEHPGLQAAVDGVVAEMQRKLDHAESFGKTAEAGRRLLKVAADDLQAKLDEARTLAARHDAAREVAEHNLRQSEAARAKLDDALSETAKLATDRARELSGARLKHAQDMTALRAELADAREQLMAAKAEIQRRDDEAARRDDVVEVKP